MMTPTPTQVQEITVARVSGDTSPRSEEEADAFACDLLIPPNDWGRFLDRADWSLAATMHFASAMGVAPGIVVGRMHHEHIIPYNRFTNLKKKFAWSETS